VKKRRLDPVIVVAAVLLLCAGGVVVWVRSTPGPVEPPPGPAPLATPDTSTTTTKSAAELADKLDKQPVKTKKGQLLKSELKKRAEAQKKLAAAGGGGGSDDRGGGVVTMSGDGTLKRALTKKLRGVVRVADSSSTGWALSLRGETGKSSGGVYVRCSAAISELPVKKLVASLSSRADVGGNSPEDESDAADACAASLAEDVASWVRGHR